MPACGHGLRRLRIGTKPQKQGLRYRGPGIQEERQMQIQPKIHIEASAPLSATVIVEQADAHGMTYHAQIDNPL